MEGSGSSQAQLWNLKLGSGTSSQLSFFHLKISHENGPLSSEPSDSLVEKLDR